ncbi:MAG: histidine phosphatase family protein, partial [Pseudomonadota bacterium]
QTEANAAKIMAGSLDSPLTDKGRTQAKDVQIAVQCLEIKPKKIIHSHLSRARDTATIINETLDIPMLEDPGYAEMHAGDWEGVSYEQSRPMLDGWVDAPNGETAQEFLNRVQNAKKTALSQQEEPMMVVCHGGVFRAFWKLYDVQSSGVKNCKLYEFTPKPSDKNLFPWDVWRYDIIENTAKRIEIDIYADPASEIA